jgi:hypothetical protein
MLATTNPPINAKRVNAAAQAIADEMLHLDNWSKIDGMNEAEVLLTVMTAVSVVQNQLVKDVMTFMKDKQSGK